MQACTNGSTVTGNSFINILHEAIRYEYGTNGGTFNIRNNNFENIGKSAIYIRSHGGQWADPVVANIEYNNFKAVATSGYVDTQIPYIAGIISTSSYSGTPNAAFTIQYNIIEECGDSLINLRDQKPKSGSTWTAVIKYNAFISVVAPTYYNRSYIGLTDSETTNTLNYTINNNYYGESDVVKATINSSQFQSNDSINTVVYDSLAELLTAIG
jgi:hypothetical protein